MAERGGGVIFKHQLRARTDTRPAGVAPELRERNIAIINIYPGMTLTERLARLMQGADTSGMERPETTAKAPAIDESRRVAIMMDLTASSSEL